MFKCFVVLACWLLYVVAIAKAQSCTATYFETSMLGGGYVTNASVTLLPGGGTIAAAYENRDYNLIKFTLAGDTVWNKVYKIEGIRNEGVRQATKLDKDGTLLCALYNDKLMRVDTNGVVLSANTVVHASEYITQDMQILDNGDIILLYISQSGYGGMMMRINKDLKTITWCKYFRFYYATYFTNLVIDNNRIVVAGGATPNEYSWDVNAFICSFDVATGHSLQLQYYVSDNIESDLLNLYKCGDGFVATAYLSGSGVNNGPHAYFRFNNDLSLQSVQHLIERDDNFLGRNTYRLAPQADGSFYMAYGGDWTLTLAYVTAKDELAWVKDMPSLYSFPTDIQQDKDALYIVGSAAGTGVVTNTVFSSFYLVKSDFNGSPGDCLPEQKPVLSFDEYSFALSNNVLKVDDTTASLTPVDVTISSYHFDVAQDCHKISACTSLHIKGINALCNTIPVTFTGSRNKSCNTPVQWSAYPATGYTLRADSDSTVSVAFSKSGVYTLRGRLQSACGDVVEDSIMVAVNLSTSLNLGNDTFLCNNNITLHAGNQFKSYRWQNGSVDSLYIITTPGTYYTTVQDYCGNIYSDTVQVSAAPVYTLSAGKDTAKCNTDTLTLTATPGFINYQWSPLDNGLALTGQTVKVFPAATTDYIVQAEKPAGCFVYDTIHVTVYHSPLIYLGNDTALCNGTELLLNAGAGFINYQWSTGEHTPSITVQNAATYTVLAKDEQGCYAADTLTVKQVFPLPQTKLLPQTVICTGSTLLLDAGVGFACQWQDNSMGQQYVATTAGVYWVKVKDNNGCTATDSTIVIGPAPLPDNFIPRDIAKCSYEEILLKANKEFNNYLWSTGATGAQLSIADAGDYWLQVRDANGCTNKNYITVKDTTCYNNIYFPTAFTPNNDGKNDVFRPTLFGNLEQFHLVIYNRWGQKIFESLNAQKGWNGYTGALLQDAGSYIWMAAYKLKGKVLTSTKGVVTLLK